MPRLKGPMPRFVLRLVLAFLLALPHASGWSQTKPAATSAIGAAPAAPPAIGATQAKDALDILRDEKKRAQLIGVLETIAKADATQVIIGPPTAPVPTSAPTPAVTSAASPLVPDSIGAQLVLGLSGRLSGLLDRAAKDFAAATDFPLVLAWIGQIATDADLQSKLVDVGWRLILILAVSISAEYGLRRGLRRPIAAIVARAPAAMIKPPDHEADGIAAAEAGETESTADTRRRQWLIALGIYLRRVPWALAANLLDLVPLALMLTVSTALLRTSIGGPVIARLVIQSAVDAYVLYRLAVTVGNLLLAPRRPRLRPLPVRDVAAADLLRWIRRIAAIAIFGDAAAKAGVFFNLYLTAQGALLKLVSLAVLVCCVAMVLQYRSKVAQCIRPAPDAIGLVANVRRRLAGLWHIVAVLYLLALWLVSALEVPDGFRWLLTGFLTTAVILIGARVLLGVALSFLGRVLQPDAHGADQPTARLQAYHPAARWIVQAVITLLAGLVLAQAWGIPVLRWFSTGTLGAHLLSTMGSIGMTLVVAVLLWEGINAAIVGHQARLSAGDQAARSARLRTLLPMLRTSLLIGIITVVALITLSEIGVNIAPLLAGAGVIGIAIGFGSQKLVQDVITGIFLLLENAMQVGDSVTLGGLSGSVEALSIRAIRLRAIDGAVHIVPFSAVTTVTNLTRDFSYAVIDVAVGLNEEPERISVLLREIATELREDEKFRIEIKADLEVFGVDRFVPNAWVMRARLRTLPGRHWAVGRELNLRIKQHFDMLKIESPITSLRALGTEPVGLDAIMAAFVQAQAPR